MEASDEELVRRFLQGDAGAFDALVIRHQREIYRVARRFTRDHAEADDLAQETFCRAFTALAEFRGESSLRTWLVRIVTHLSLNAIQSPRLTRREATPIEVLAARGGPATAVEAAGPAALIERERAGRLRLAMESLPPRQKATLKLRVFEELPYREIAAIMGCTIGTAKANFFHAVAFLRRALHEGK